MPESKFLPQKEDEKKGNPLKLNISKEELATKIRELGSPEAVTAWVREVTPDLSIDQAAQLHAALKDYILEQNEEVAAAGPPDPFDPDPDTPYSDEADDVADLAKARKEVEDHITGLQPQGETPGDADGDGDVDQEDAEQLQQGEFGAVNEDLRKYDWIFQELQIPQDEAMAAAASGQSALDALFTEEDKQQILDNLAFFYGDHFASWDQLVQSGYLDRPSAENKLLISAATTDTEPPLAFEVALPGMDSQYIRERDVAAAQAQFGAGPKDISTYVKLAAAAKMFGGDGKTVVWQPLMALTRGSDLFRQLQEERKRVAERMKQEEDDRAAQQVMGVVKDAFDMAEQQGPYKVYGSPDDPASESTDEPTSEDIAFDYADTFMPSDPYGAGNVGGKLDNVRDFGGRFQDGLKVYADVGVAYIHALDPELAQRMVFAYENDLKMGDKDQALASRLLAERGFYHKDELKAFLVNSGYVEADDYKFFGMGGDMFDDEDAGSGAERIINLPDPEQVRESVKELYRNLFLDDPSEDQIQQFSTQVMSVIEGNQRNTPDTINQQTNERSQLQSLFENTDLYRQLYKNKPGGMSELEYSGMFRVGAQEMLGAEAAASNEAIKAGMVSGDLQTTLGSILGNQESWDNSTFMGRLARAAQVVADQT